MRQRIGIGRGRPRRCRRLRGSFRHGRHRRRPASHQRHRLPARIGHQAHHGNRRVRGGRRGAARTGPAHRDLPRRPASHPAAPLRCPDRAPGPAARCGLGTHYDFRYADSAAIMPVAREVMTRYGTLYREPGTLFEYSNLGYGLLDLVLRTVSGQEPAEFVRERVFGPLGLASCHIGPSYEGRAAEALRYSADGRRYPLVDTSHRGASLGWATAPDLAMFGLSQAGGPGVLARGTSAVMHTALPTDDHRLGYGLGWFVSRGDRHTIVSHSGSMGGAATMLIVVPDQQLSVCVLTNQTGVAARSAVAGHVMSELVPGFALAALPPAISAERAVRAGPGAWAGRIDTYLGAVPLAVRITPDLRAEIRLDGGAAVPAHFVGGSPHWDLRLAAPVQLPTPDARVASPLLGLELSADQDGGLNGAARAYSDGEGDGWHGNLLSHWCELRALM